MSGSGEVRACRSVRVDTCYGVISLTPNIKHGRHGSCPLLGTQGKMGMMPALSRHQKNAISCLSSLQHSPGNPLMGIQLAPRLGSATFRNSPPSHIMTPSTGLRQGARDAFESPLPVLESPAWQSVSNWQTPLMNTQTEGSTRASGTLAVVPSASAEIISC